MWSNGILLEYIEGDKKSETAFFPINTLHYCAAVRYVNVTGYAVEGSAERLDVLHVTAYSIRSEVVFRRR